MLTGGKWRVSACKAIINPALALLDHQWNANARSIEADN